MTDMDRTTLVQRLREFWNPSYAVQRPRASALCEEAADEIERLQRELVRRNQRAVREELLDKIDAVLDALPKGARYLDPPDGGDVPIAEQVRRMASELAEARERRDEWIKESCRLGLAAETAQRELDEAEELLSDARRNLNTLTLQGMACQRAMDPCLAASKEGER